MYIFCGLITYTKIEQCSSSDADNFAELDDLDLDDDFRDELIDEIKNVKLAFEYDDHYDCYCKSHRACPCGCDLLHKGLV